MIVASRVSFLDDSVPLTAGRSSTIQPAFPVGDRRNRAMRERTGLCIVHLGDLLAVRYQRVKWHHDNRDEPVVLYSEIDPDGWETRKVDEYADGRLSFADAIVEMGETWLADKPAELSVEEIDALQEFSASLISKAAFEHVWLRARSQPGPFTLSIVPASTDAPLALTDTRRMGRALLEFQPAQRSTVVSDKGGAFRVTGSASAEVAPAVLEVIAETVGVPFRIQVTREA